MRSPAGSPARGGLPCQLWVASSISPAELGDQPGFARISRSGSSLNDVGPQTPIVPAGIAKVRRAGRSPRRFPGLMATAPTVKSPSRFQIPLDVRGP